MANRSYLYSTDNLPESPEWMTKKSLQGISEYRYDIPLVFKLLLSGNPVACRSSIWETPEKIALVGDYVLGQANLRMYLDRIPDQAIVPLVEEANQFLNAPAHARRYFVLECGEIFDLTKGSLAEKNNALLQEIQNLGKNVTSIPTPKSTGAKATFFSKLFRLKVPDPLSPYYDLGLGFWSEVLYFDLRGNEA